MVQYQPLLTNNSKPLTAIEHVEREAAHIEPWKLLEETGRAVCLRPNTTPGVAWGLPQLQVGITIK